MNFAGLGEFDVNSVLGTAGDAMRGLPAASRDQQFGFASAGMRNSAKQRASQYMNDAIRQGAQIDAAATVAEGNTAATGTLVSAGIGALGSIGGALLSRQPSSWPKGGSYQFPQYESSFSSFKPVYGWG